MQLVQRFENSGAKILDCHLKYIAGIMFHTWIGTSLYLILKKLEMDGISFYL